MGRKKKRKKKAPPRTGRARITPAAVVGLVIGILMVVIGLNPGPGREVLGGYYVAGLGAVFIAVVAWITLKKKY